MIAKNQTVDARNMEKEVIAGSGIRKNYAKKHV